MPVGDKIETSVCPRGKISQTFLRAKKFLRRD